MDAIAKLKQLNRGHFLAEVLNTSVRMGIADILNEGPRSAEEIATEIQKTGACQVHFLKRLLRAAAAAGIIDYHQDDQKYALNDVSKLLVDGPSTSKWGVLLMQAPIIKSSLTLLEDNVRNGTYAFKSANGDELFEYLKEKNQQELFNKFMRSVARDAMVAEIMSKRYSLQSFKHVVDVGGGIGLFLAHLLRFNPHLTGTVFDLPAVVEDGKKLLETDHKDIKDRLSFEAGNFFESVPTGGDLYMSKTVLHDWNSEKSKVILKNIHNAMSNDAKLVILDFILKDGDEMGSIQDIQMMVICDGQERTVDEFKALYEDTGFTFTQVVPLDPHITSIVEGVKKH